MKVDTISFEIGIAKKCVGTRCTILRMVVAHAIEIALYPNANIIVSLREYKMISTHSVVQDYKFYFTVISNQKSLIISSFFSNSTWLPFKNKCIVTNSWFPNYSKVLALMPKRIPIKAYDLLLA